MACGSEPNLHVSESGNPAAVKARWLHRKLNSQSEMNLNVLENLDIVDDASSQSRSRQSSLPDVCSDGTDFLCIPPPPAYRNEDESDSKLPVSQSQNEVSFLFKLHALVSLR